MLQINYFAGSTIYNAIQEIKMNNKMMNGKRKAVIITCDHFYQTRGAHRWTINYEITENNTNELHAGESGASASDQIHLPFGSWIFGLGENNLIVGKKKK